MPWNGSGTFSLTYNWEDDKTAGINPKASRFEAQDADIASGLSLCLTADGQRKVSAPFDANTFRVINVGDATSATDALNRQTGDARYLALAGGTLSGALNGTSGSFSGTFAASLFSGSGASLTSLDAGNLASGTVPTARLGSGSASASSYLRGDSTWVQPSFAALSGSIANGQVPQSAVTQHQAALSISGSQVTSAVANASHASTADSATSASSATSATSASSATTASQANTLLINGGYRTFSWSEQSGQPTWLWGSNDSVTIEVWNPANFSVSHASTADSATSASSATTASSATSATNATHPANAASFLEELMLSSAVTLQSDPGGTPSSGTAGSIVAYY